MNAAMWYSLILLSQQAPPDPDRRDLIGVTDPDRQELIGVMDPPLRDTPLLSDLVQNVPYKNNALSDSRDRLWVLRKRAPGKYDLCHHCFKMFLIDDNTKPRQSDFCLCGAFICSTIVHTGGLLQECLF